MSISYSFQDIHFGIILVVIFVIDNLFGKLSAGMFCYIFDSLVLTFSNSLPYGIRLNSVYYVKPEPNS